MTKQSRLVSEEDTQVYRDLTFSNIIVEGAFDLRETPFHSRYIYGCRILGLDLLFFFFWVMSLNCCLIDTKDDDEGGFVFEFVKKGICLIRLSCVVFE